MSGVRTSYSFGRYTPAEYDAVLGSVKTDLAAQPRGIVWCHGSGQLAIDALLQQRLLQDKLGRNATIHVGDLGGQTWGNDTVVTRIGEAIALLRNDYGVERIALVGMSMGGLNALNYLVRYPDELECAALLIPATDLPSLRANPALVARWPEIDAIYGGDYAGHNPIGFVGDIPEDFPLKIWWSTNDPLVYPSTIEAFLTARPQTERLSMGAVSHDVPYAFNTDIFNWLNRKLP